MVVKKDFFTCCLLILILFLSIFFAKNIMAVNQIVVNDQGGNQMEQSGTGIRFETGSVSPMWGSAGQYTFQTNFIDPQGRQPEFVKIYLQRGGDNVFENHLMQKVNASGKSAAYSFSKTIFNSKEGIYQFYFEAKIGNKLIHGPSYWGENCKPGGCGECCGVWGGPKILSTKLIEDNKIYLFEKEKNNPVVVFDVGKKWITSVDISLDDKYFAAADNEQNLYLFDVQQKKLKWQFKAPPVTDTGNLGMDKGMTAFSNNGYLAASLKGVVFLFKIESGELIWSFPTNAVLNGLAISENSELIAAGGRDTYVYLWNTKNSNLVWKHKIEAKGGMMGGSVIRSLDMTPSGELFVVGTSCPDRSIHVFSPNSSNPVFKAKVGVNFPVESVGLSDDGQYILAGGGGSKEDPYSAVFYKLKKENPVWNFETSVNPTNEVAISNNGEFCAIGSILEGIFINKCADNKPLWRVKETGYIGSLSFSDKGKYLAAGTGANHVLLISIGEKKIINDWETSGKAEATKISKSGKLVAVGTGLNRFIIISGEGTNSSGTGAETTKVKPEIVGTTSMNNQVSIKAVKNGWLGKLKTWFLGLFNKTDSKKQTITCGNGLCEPDLGETATSCVKDCTPSSK